MYTLRASCRALWRLRSRLRAALGGGGRCRVSCAGEGGWVSVLAVDAGVGYQRQRDRNGDVQFPPHQVLDFLFLEVRAIAGVGGGGGGFRTRGEALWDRVVTETVEGLEGGGWGFGGGGGGGGSGGGEVGD